MNIGTRIRELRIEKGLSQQQFSEKIGVNQNTLSRYENNIIKPSLDVLVLIADTFDVTTDFLLNRVDF